MTVSDYSAYLTPERLAVEEVAWEQTAIYRLYADTVLYAAARYGCNTVLEVGCGTGWVPTRLPESLAYIGLDANPECLTLARQKTERLFIWADARVFRLEESVDLVCSFAVLKHFALHEWASVLGKILSFGRVGVFTMNVGDADADDFEQGYPHTWVSPFTLGAAVAGAGHQIESSETIYTGESMVITRGR